MAKKKMYQRPDGLYETIRVINGKRVAFRGHTIREVEQKMISYKETSSKGDFFKVYADQWWGEFVEKAAPNSLKGYRPAYNRAVERFGEKRISEITAGDIKVWIAALIKQEFAKKTIKTHLIVMSQVFKHAAEETSVDYNPASIVRIPSDLSQETRELPSDEEDRKMMANVTKPFGLFPFLAKYTGARRGELLGLKYGDFDFLQKTIRIQRSVYYDNITPKLKAPKSKAGIRTVPMLDIVAAALPRGANDEFIFGGKEPLSRCQFDAMWETYKKQTGVTATPHQWRHMYATLLYNADIPVKEAQVLMGHSQFSTTMDIYTHIKEKRLEVSAAKLNALEQNSVIG